MMYSRTFAVLSVMLIAYAFADQSLLATENNRKTPNEEVSHILSDEKADRSRTLMSLNRQYNAESTNLDIALSEAVKKHKKNNRYMSPLHAAILAVESWRIYESEDTLILIVDYELDAASIPVGMDMAGYSFYPAATALVELRADTTKVVDAIAATKSDKKLQLLTWVLYRRTKSSDETTRLLNATGGEKLQKNIQKALRLVKHAEHHSDLLPISGKPKEDD